GSKKSFRRRFPIQLQIEGAKITALPAEWYMEVQPDRSSHDVSENGMGFEKSLAKTISISSVDEIPRLRTCDVQAGCWRSDSKICFSMCGLMRDSHSRNQAWWSSSPSYSSGKEASRLNRRVNVFSS